MGNAVHQIRGHVLDMLASNERLRDYVRAQAALQHAGAAPLLYVLERAFTMLQTHCGDIRAHLHCLGGGTAPPEGESRDERAVPSAKPAADLFARLSFMRAAAMMLETDARVLGFSSTAALATRHREEIDAVLVQLREVMPQAA